MCFEYIHVDVSFVSVSLFSASERHLRSKRMLINVMKVLNLFLFKNQQTTFNFFFKKIIITTASEVEQICFHDLHLTFVCQHANSA